MESTLSVRGERDYVVFIYGNLSFFSIFDFFPVDCVVFFLNWIFLGGLLGLGFEFFVSLELGCALVVYCMRVGGFEEEWKKLKSTLNGLDFGILITSIDLVFGLGLEFCSRIGLTFRERGWIKLGNLILVGWILHEHASLGSPKETYYLNPMRYHDTFIENIYCYRLSLIVTQFIRNIWSL